MKRKKIECVKPGPDCKPCTDPRHEVPCCHTHCFACHDECTTLESLAPGKSKKQPASIWGDK